MTPSRDDGERAGRNKQLAAIHIAAARLFGDVSKKGEGRELYEDWLERLGGVRSAGLLDDAGRKAVIAHLRAQNLLPERKFKSTGGAGLSASGEARPTRRQWNKIGGMARDMGWDEGLEDARLAGFVKRTAKVDLVRFLTRRQASQVIVGLERWLAKREADKRKGGRKAGR